MTVEKAVRLSNEELSNIATDLVSRAASENITLKVIGGLATYIRCSSRSDILQLYGKVERLGKDKPTFADVDFIGFSRQEREIQKFMQGMGYEPDRYVNALFSGTRNVFSNSHDNFYVDVFYDTLNFSHDVVLVDRERNRLSSGAVTILPTDLMLSKLQVHDMTRKDLVDIVLLLLGHEFGEDSADSISAGYISSILADDWGFHYDAISNLEKARSESLSMLSSGVLSGKMQKDVNGKIDYLLRSIESSPKTRTWEKRAKKGTKKIWYREVDEL